MKHFSLSRLLREQVVRQYDSVDCAPAALLSVLKYHGGNAALARVRQLCGTDSRGTPMAMLVAGARAVGFIARGAAGTYDDLSRERLPCIAHVVTAERTQHYVVVYRIDRGGVRLGDPARGIRSLSRAEFESIWLQRAVVLLEPTDAIVSERPPHWTDWMIGYLRTDASWIYQSLFLGALYTALGLLTSVLLRLLIDRAIPSRSLRFTLITGALLLAAQLVRAGAGYLRQRFLIDVNARVSVRMTADFLAHIFRLPIQFFDTRATGDITARINDTVKIQSAMLRAIGATVVDLLIVVGSLGFIFVFSVPLGLVALLTVPVYGAALGLASRGVRDRHRRAMQSFAKVESTYIDSLTGIDAVRSFNAAGVFSRLTAGRFETFQSELKLLGLTQARVVLWAEIVGGSVIAAMVTYSTVLVMTGRVALGGMLAAYSLLAGVLPAIARLIDAYIALQGASVAASRLMDLLLLSPEPNPGTRPFSLHETISLERVEFIWPRGTRLLSDVSLRIERGRVTALWGPSGVGKSTIVRLLERKYEPTGGRILIDGVDAQAFDIADYRQNITVVPETVKLFNATLLDNIALGRSAPEIDDPLMLIHTLGLAPFLERFGGGPFTLLGEEGRQLSSGERQVIAMLRAMASNPGVLIVDEGLNAVDAELSAILGRAIEEYARYHAVLLISHNIQTIAHADYVYVVADGRIQREGPLNAMADGLDHLGGTHPGLAHNSERRLVAL